MDIPVQIDSDRLPKCHGTPNEHLGSARVSGSCSIDLFYRSGEWFDYNIHSLHN